jgi:hypothetical protein
MTYLDQSEIGANSAMFSRVAQCAAQQGETSPDDWTNINRRIWSAAPGWDDAWASAKAAHPPEPPDIETPGLAAPAYDPGADHAVITDEMILSQVQAMLAEQPEA